MVVGLTPVETTDPFPPTVIGGGHHGQPHSGAAWKEVWLRFSQNTTIHGVNKITEDTPFMWRR